MLWGERLAALVHLLAAVVGLGGLSADLLTDAQLTRAEGAEAYAVARTTYRRGARRDELALVLLALSGVAVVALSDGAIGAGEPWVAGTALCYAAVAVVLRWLVTPTRRRALVLLGGLAGPRPTEVATKRAELASLTRRLRLGSALIHLAAFGALTSIVLRPGS